ncbi:unnamed protein product [Paramecium primaurelia]|uniref:Uncharacterized protein n=1 Tax=Paramecium primaurelia TaxID=5886 RepID=A0A8S1LTZ6_PARPR|nr:unnamed protein product [Paramecium primaurelia]
MFQGFKKSTSIKSTQESLSKQNSTSLNQEKTLNQLRQKKCDLENIIENYCQRLEYLDLQCRQHISCGRKTAAKCCIREMNTLRKQIEMYHTKINVLIKITIQIETMHEDQELGNLMEQATSLFRNQEELNEQLTNNLQNWQEVQESQVERDNLFKDMEDKWINSQEIDEALNQYEEEIKQEKLTQQFNSVPSQKIQSLKQNQQVQQNQVISEKGDLMLN